VAIYTRSLQDRRLEKRSRHPFDEYANITVRHIFFRSWCLSKFMMLGKLEYLFAGIVLDTLVAFIALSMQG